MNLSLLLLIASIVCFVIATLAGFGVLVAPTLAWVAAGLACYAATVIAGSAVP